MRHWWQLLTNPFQERGVPVLLAPAVGDWQEHVVSEAPICLLSIQHELQGLALISLQRNGQTLHSIMPVSANTGERQ